MAKVKVNEEERAPEGSFNFGSQGRCDADRHRHPSYTNFEGKVVPQGAVCVNVGDAEEAEWMTRQQHRGQAGQEVMNVEAIDDPLAPTNGVKMVGKPCPITGKASFIHIDENREVTTLTYDPHEECVRANKVAQSNDIGRSYGSRGKMVARIPAAVWWKHLLEPAAQQDDKYINRWLNAHPDFKTAVGDGVYGTRT